MTTKLGPGYSPRPPRKTTKRNQGNFSRKWSQTLAPGEAQSAGAAPTLSRASKKKRWNPR